MPFIGVNTTMTLSKNQKDEIKERLGKIITLIPGKTEAVLMIDISEGHSMYFSGKELKNCAFIDVRCYKSAPFERNKEFTEKVYEVMEEVTGIKPEEMYISISELPIWGTKGSLK